MASFSDTKKKLRASSAKSREVYAEWLQAREALRGIGRERDKIVRSANGDRDRALAQLDARAKKTAKQEARLKERYDAAESALADAVGAFSTFADPEKAVSQLVDDTPIALFPLRLETRYRTVQVRNRAHRQLCVRAYPDDILVDSFQPEISLTEIDNLTIYWTNVWRSGDKRTAWLALAKAHGAGRAHWLTNQYAPLNQNEQPSVGANDYTLVIVPSIPVPDGEKDAISKFWAKVWSSKGADRDAAFADLAGALSNGRAAEIEAELAPANLNDADARPEAGALPVVAFLNLPDPATLPTSVEDWTRGPRSWMLPERLMLLGFQDGVETVRQMGAPIPNSLQVGPDPSAAASDQLTSDEGAIHFPKGMQWMVDFDRAVADGMGFIIDLTAQDIVAEFDRLFVLGLRFTSDAEEGAAELAMLFAHHQATRKGLSLLQQGQATNNIDGETANYSWWENNEAAFVHHHEIDHSDDPSHWEPRTDGAWLAGLLGIDAAALRDSPNYYGTEQAEARAMNRALWPATLGYYMEQMMEPVFSDATVSRTREFFTRHVLGRGTLPLVRMGKQPYGVMPACAWSRAAWWRTNEQRLAATFRPRDDERYFENLHQLIERGVGIWNTLSADVPHVGNGSADPQQTLLRILELHPASVEFYQRYSQSFTQYYNLLGIESELVSNGVSEAMIGHMFRAMATLEELGWIRGEEELLPELVHKMFLKTPTPLRGDVVATELSESTPLPVGRADGLNYIAWLQTAARLSHDALRKQEGFFDAPPNALLYLMLHHALDLGFVDAGLQVERSVLEWSDVQYAAARREPGYIAVGEQAVGISRWASLYKAAPAITGDASIRLGDFLPGILAKNGLYLDRQLSALDHLKNVPSARLERAFVDHIDCLSYRLDAWRLGLQSVQLSRMRGETAEGFGKGGVYLGAYGWVEGLKPRDGSLSPVQLDAKLAAIFDVPAAPPLQRDSSNFGHIHAPSLDQAVTAAVLRNGHLANATPSQPDILAVDLSSERVRLAQRVIEGMRNGQSLGALLGYRLERALHDEPDLFLDRLIYRLRCAFPLIGNRNSDTHEPNLESITQVEARNVLDGEAFAEHIHETDATSYPYGLTGLPPLNDFVDPSVPTPSAVQIGVLIDGHVAAMRSIGDAVADLAVAEGVYQMVRGNHDRAAGSLDAFSKGIYPPEVEVAATPRSGKTLTHRMSLHLQGGVASGMGGPRTQGEPALAAWIADHMPDPATVFARITWKDGAGGNDSLTPNMAELGLDAVDLFYMIDSGGAREMAGFDDILIDHAASNAPLRLRDDAVFSLEYMPDGTGGLTIFQLAPLVRSLRGVVLGARPLRPTDLSLQNEAGAVEDAAIALRPDKAQNVRNLLQGQLGSISAFIATLETAIGTSVDHATVRIGARDAIDGWLPDFAALGRAIVPFGLQAAGLTAGVEGRRAPFAAMLKLQKDIEERLARKLVAHETAMTEYDALPGAASDEQRIALLIRAGREISTKVIAPLPPTIGDLEAEIADQRTDFNAATGALSALKAGAARTGALLKSLEDFLPTYQSVDLTPVDLTPFADSLVALSRDLLARAQALKIDIERRVAKADEALAELPTLAGEKARETVEKAAHAILGEAYVVLPEFSIEPARTNEWAKSWADRADLVAHLKAGPQATPLPLDDWLHGIARVRPRPRHIEMAGHLAVALGASTGLSLDTVQFPWRANDVWLGMTFPDVFGDGSTFSLEGNKLLYTALIAPGAEIVATDPTKTYTGLLLDEWTEFIPALDETTGLAFHYDRPNTEAPQTILLVTPPEHRGTWQLDDVIDAMHETLDMARLRAVDPVQLDTVSALGSFLPALLSAVTVLPITAALNFALNNDIHLAMAEINS